MQISEPKKNTEQGRGLNHPVWQLAFRAFFLAGAAFSAISVGLWVLQLVDEVSLPQAVLPSLVWHAHEMIFGFAALIAVGFILTAVQTWTGRPSIKGLPVMILLFVWALIRGLLFVNTSETVLLALALLLSWWGYVVATYASIVITAHNRRNYLFIPLLVALGSLDLISLSLAFIGKYDVSMHLMRSAVLLFTVIMGVVGGRVIPFFTVRGANTQVKDSLPWLEKSLLPVAISGISVFILGYFITLPFTPAALMILAGMLHLIRMTRWSSATTLSVPLLWSLHISYALMALGLIALGLSYQVAILSFSSALHLITLGAIGLMIIAMMSRVSLGHTGRMLVVKPQIVIAFLCLITAALLRFVLPILGLPLEAWVFSAVLWVIAFSIFFITYWPVLTAPRQ